MKILLGKYKLFIIALVLLVFCENVNAQCTITTTTNASTLNNANICTTFSGCKTIYIGNGSTSMTLTINENIDFSCLGPIQLVIRNAATIFFEASNRLTLAAGSNIVIESGGDISEGTPCSASQRIYIGNDIISSCNGGAGAETDFGELVTNGGYSSITASASPNSFCNSGSSTITAMANPSSGATYKWYTVPSGGTSIFTGNPYLTPTISSTATYYVEAIFSTYTTVRKAVTVTVNPLPTITGSLNVCEGSTTTLIGSDTANATTPWTSATTAVATVSSSGVVTGVSAGTSVITYMNSNGCTKTATVTVRSLVNNVGTGFSGSSFCAGEQATITFDANNTSGVYPYTLVYRNDATDATASVTIANDDPTAINLSPNPTATTDYTLLSITDSNGCVRTSGFGDSTARVTISALPTAPAVGTITHPTCTLATGTVVLSGLPSGNWTINPGGITGNTTSTTISGLATGTYNFTVTNASGCKSLASANVGINAQPATPTAPAVSITQPTCTLSTGTISVTVQDIGETYSFDNGVTFQPGNNKSGLASGNYDVIIKSNGGCDSPATNATIKNATNIWNGSAWSNGTLPISTENIEFNGNYPPVPNPNVDISGCSCTISSGTNVTIKSGRNLIITNEVSVLGTGTLTFENSASLVQINNVPNSGNIKYVRTTNTAVLSTDYTYWSSPVSPQTIGDFSPKTQEGMMYSYDSSVDDWKQEYLSTSMVAGLGYIVRGPEPSAVPTPPSPYMATFEGVPHNGDYSIPAIADKSYLLGNPYPSALDADTFLAANANVLNGTLYFWTHNTGIGTNVSNPGTGVYAYSGDDYATYNATGGVGAAPPDLDSTTGSAPSDPGHPVPPSLVDNGKIPTGKIAAGQGFFASTKTSISGSSIVYNNNMRVGVGGITGTNSQFFKTRNPKEKTTSTIQKNRVWLNLTNTQGAFKQTLVGYITDATNDYDSRFDGESFDGNEFVDFYSINEDKNLAIQGRALPFDENDEVPLGFRTTINGTFSINIDQVDGLLANQQVFIEDKLTNTLSDLKSGNYTFTTAPGTFNDRFVLRYKDNTSDKILSVDETKANDGIVVLYSNNYKTLIIRNNLPDAIVNSITLFNMLGQKITHWDIKERDQTSIQIPIKNVIPEIYIVKVKTTEGETSKRIIIR